MQVAQQAPIPMQVAQQAQGLLPTPAQALLPTPAQALLPTTQPPAYPSLAPMAPVYYPSAPPPLSLQWNGLAPTYLYYTDDLTSISYQVGRPLVLKVL